MEKFDFANKLYALRTENNLTQKELAMYLGVTNKAVSKWETGESMPRTKTLQAIAECFNVTYADLLSNEPMPEKLPPYKVYYKNMIDKKKQDIIIDQKVFIGISVVMILAKLIALIMYNLFYEKNIIYSAISLISVIIIYVFCNVSCNTVVKNINNIEKISYAPILFMIVPLDLISIVDTLIFSVNGIGKLSTLFVFILYLIFISISIFLLTIKKNTRAMTIGIFAIIGSTITFSPMVVNVGFIHETNLDMFYYIISITLDVFPLSIILDYYFLNHLTSDISSQDDKNIKDKLYKIIFITMMVLFVFWFLIVSPIIARICIELS